MTPDRRHRTQRIAARIQALLGEAIPRRVRDPRVGFVTVTGVEVSPDVSHAVVRVSVMGSDDEKERAMEGLASARGYLRTRLARTLGLRVAPELHFILDRGLEHATRIDELLDRLSHGEKL